MLALRKSNTERGRRAGSGEGPSVARESRSANTVSWHWILAGLVPARSKPVVSP